MIKKFIKLVFAVMLVLGMTTSTIYANDGSATITIQRGNDVTKSLTDMTVKAYMVLDQVNDNETTPNKKQYSVTDAFKNFFDIEKIKNKFDSAPTVYLGYDSNNSKLVSTKTATADYIAINGAQLDTTYPEADIISRLNANNCATFYTWVEKYIDSLNLTPTKTATATEEDSVSLSNLNEGYYALTFEAVPSGISVIQGILVATPGNVTLKAEPLTVTKTVSKDERDFKEEISAAMSDTLTYQVKSKVPTLTDYSNLTQFEMKDTLSHQQLVANSFSMTVGDNAVTFDSQSKEFTLNTKTIAKAESITNNSFIVKFKTDILSQYQGQEIVLKYKAQMTEDAVNINDNNLELTYRNGPDTSVLSDKTKVYTYCMKINKKFSDGSTNHYADVKFKLYSDANCNTQISLAGSNGVYTTKAADNTASDGDLVLASDGSLTIKGLDAGTYYLKETATAEDAGFTLADVIKVQLVAKNDELQTLDSTSSATMDGNVLKVSITQENTISIALATFDVLNQKGFDLPTTGGAGTWMITLGGIALIAVAGSLYVVSKKKKIN